MTKFDFYVEDLVRARAEKRDEECNRRLKIGLATKTHEEAVEALLGGLTIILGVSDMETAKTFVV